jgi:hypothetical protein
MNTLKQIVQKMTFPQALMMSKGLNQDCDVANNLLQTFPKGAFGLTPDDVKSSTEFKAAKFAYDVAFQHLRNFNQYYTKQFKCELVKMRDEKRVKKIAEHA